MIATGFGPFHCRHPLVIIAEEWKVEKWTHAVGLGADRQLRKDPPHCLGATPKPCRGDRIFKPLVRLPSMHVRWRRARKTGNGFTVRHCGRIPQKVAEVLIQGQKFVGCAIENFDDFGRSHIIDDKEGRLWVRVLSAQRANVFACVTTIRATFASEVITT